MTSSIKCDQAIFTSIRTPVGEGYRIVAASRNITPAEKQVITRNSPSHDSLCAGGEGAAKDEASRSGVSFFAVSDARLCVSFSCSAGAEHTGRGGQRVYTHHVIIQSKDFECCNYNPFVILRAMEEAGLTTPQVPPPKSLDEIELPISEASLKVSENSLSDKFDSAWRKHCLEALLNDDSLIINLDDGWDTAAESFLLGLPGPARVSFSFSAGIRFSTGRCHRLSLVHDTSEKTRNRIAGKKVAYVDPSHGEPPMTVETPWITFVNRLWEKEDTATLAARTSQPFSDVSCHARNRIAKLYLDMDAVSQATMPKCLELAKTHLHSGLEGTEATIATELIEKAKQTCMTGLAHSRWTEVKSHLDSVASMWQDSKDGASFAFPILDSMLQLAANDSPRQAAEIALPLAQNCSAYTDKSLCDALFNKLLSKLADWTPLAPDSDVQAIAALASRWRALLPDCPHLERIQQACETHSTPQGND